jgi:protein-histidine pros-kinase
VAIRDTGIGIKSEDIPRLFGLFEQLESGTTRRYDGMGLGLILTQKIVELQGGTIGVESDVGQGSCFTIVLPLVLAEPTFDP